MQAKNFQVKSILVLALLLLISWQLSAQQGLLKKTVVISNTKGTVASILKEIGENGNFYFSYSNVIINDKLEIEIPFNRGRVKSFLDFIFKGKSIDYIEWQNKVILKSITEKTVEKQTIRGTIIDKTCNDGISTASVWVKGTEFGAVSNERGKFSLEIPASETEVTLTISHISYKPVEITVFKEDFKNIKVYLVTNIFDLKEIKIFGTPEIVFGNTSFNIYDYELFENYIMLVVYENKLLKSNLLLVDENIKPQCFRDCPGPPVGLYRDCADQLQLITYYAPYEVTINGNCISTRWSKQDWKNRLTKPCTGSAKNGWYYYYFYGPARLSVDFAYHNSDLNADSVFRHIDDSLLIRKASEKQNKKQVGKNNRGCMADTKIGDYSGDDNENFYFDFQNKLDFIYTPMYYFNDSIYIFNHVEKSIEVYNSTAHLNRRIPMHYINEQGWMRKIILDKVQNKVYTYFNRGQYFDFYEIDLRTGKLKDGVKVNFPEIQKAQIHNGTLYFIYKPGKYNYRKCLYKQKI